MGSRSRQRRATVVRRRAAAWLSLAVLTLACSRERAPKLPLEAVFPNAWSLTRGPKAEIVFGHLVRSMSFVDPARVVYAGGSAGG